MKIQQHPHSTSLSISADQLHKVSFEKVRKGAKLPSSLQKRRNLSAAVRQSDQPDIAPTVVFQSRNRGLLSVKAPVLMVGNEFLVLRGGHLIPLNSIAEVRP